MAKSPAGKTPAPPKAKPQPAARKKAAGIVTPAPKAKTAQKAPANPLKAPAKAPKAPRAQKPQESPDTATPWKPTEKQRRFIEEYLVDLNASQAAIRAGYSADTAGAIGHELLKKPEIQAEVAFQRKKQQERTQIEADRVVIEAWNIATADPRELVEYRVGCCRYCWGKDHRFQFTAVEMERAEAEHAEKCEKAIKEGKPHPGDFDPKGGIGYHRLREPNPACPECFGEGQGRTVFKDTSKISPAVASLFAGIKETKEGMEVKLHSKDGALEKLFKHLGLYEKDNEQKTDPLASLLARVASGGGNTFKPVAKDPERPNSIGPKPAAPDDDGDD